MVDSAELRLAKLEPDGFTISKAMPGWVTKRSFMVSYHVHLNAYNSDLFPKTMYSDYILLSNAPIRTLGI